MSVGFGFSLPALAQYGGGGNNPFGQLGPTLDLSFAGTVTDLSDPNGYTLNTNFIAPEYQVAAQYTIWETNVGLVSKTFGDIITFTRASTGTYFSSAGVLTSAAINAPRFDYNPSTLVAQGLLIEESRTNSIRNNTAQGAVAGTPGTLPTNWFAASTATGVARSVIGTGTENGIAYIDIRFNGTATSSGQLQAGFEVTNQVAATVGQTWASTVYWKLASGSATGLSNWRVFVNEYSSVPAYLTSQIVLVNTPTASGLATQRVGGAITTANASCAYVQPVVGADVTNGAAIDITLRIGLPQLELGAFATSVIPTTTTALTRAADVASVNTLSPWFNASAGTLYVEWVTAYVTSGLFPSIASIRTAANTSVNTFEIFQVGTSAASPNGLVRIAGTDQIARTLTGVTFGTVAKAALGFETDNSAFYVNGAVVGPIDTSGSLSGALMVLMNIGNGSGAQYINSYVRRVTYYPRRLSASELAAITA